MKILTTIFLFPFLLFSQEKSQTIGFGFGRTCVGGTGRCLNNDASINKNIEFDFIVKQDTLLLYIPTIKISESDQSFIFGKKLSNFLSTEKIKVNQPINYIFDINECMMLKLNTKESFGILKGDYSAYKENNNIYIVLKINKITR